MNDFVDEATRTISGVVLEDTKNGTIGDTPIGGVVVEYRFPNGTVVATTITDSNGVYVFTGVVPGV